MGSVLSDLPRSRAYPQDRYQPKLPKLRITRLALVLTVTTALNGCVRMVTLRTWQGPPPPQSALAFLQTKSVKGFEPAVLAVDGREPQWPPGRRNANAWDDQVGLLAGTHVITFAPESLGTGSLSAEPLSKTVRVEAGKTYIATMTWNLHTTYQGPWTAGTLRPASSAAGSWDVQIGLRLGKNIIPVQVQ